MALTNSPIFPPAVAYPEWMSRDNEFTRILNAREVLFYCPTCDAMAYIGRMRGFNPAPWRTDIFAWRNPPVNRPDVKRTAQ